MFHKIKWLPLLVFLLLNSGCTTLAVTGAGVAVSYTLTNVAYKTFNHPLDKTEVATLMALSKMDIKVVDYNKISKGREIKALTGDLDIKIELKAITLKATRIKVDATKNHVLKDRATATEIIHQVEIILEGKG